MSTPQIQELTDAVSRAWADATQNGPEPEAGIFEHIAAALLDEGYAMALDFTPSTQITDERDPLDAALDAFPDAAPGVEITHTSLKGYPLDEAAAPARPRPPRPTFG